MTDVRFDKSVAYLVDHPYGRCSRCSLSWKRVNGHITTIIDTNSGMFVLCDACWGELTPEDRLPHYRVAFDRNTFDAERNGRTYEYSWEDLKKSVLAERVAV